MKTHVRGQALTTGLSQQTSFVRWLESRDPELFMILEAEWGRRGRKPIRSGLMAGAAAAAVAAGLGWWMTSGKPDDKPLQPDNRPRSVAVTNTVVEEGEPGNYMGGDREDIFRYACEQSHNGINIFPYYVNGRQKGLIARLSLPNTPTSPLSARTLNARYSSFVSQIRSTMKGRNVLKIDGEVAGQGPVNWQLITWDENGNKAKDNPNRAEAGMVEIVFYAEKTAGVK